MGMELSENAKKFLLYSYFGLTEKELDNKETDVVIQCAKIAYRDLARTIKYTKASSDLKHNDQNIRKEHISTICSFISNKMKELEESEEDFDNWHKTLMDSIINKMNSVNCDICSLNVDFTYG